MIPEELRPFFSFPIISTHILGGGSINEVYRLQTDAGDFCLKYNRLDSFPGMFEAEAAGLRLLSAAGCIRTPDIIETGHSAKFRFILLEYIEPGRQGPRFMEDFGHRLADLHRNKSDQFGLDHDNYMGALPQSNKFHDAWTSFFIEERLERQVRLAASAGLLNRSDLNRFERLYGRLGNLVPVETPSLIHGDLWGGNYLCSSGGEPCLIDPAVHYGHRETDLAMTILFGGFEKAFYSAYHESFPLVSGWEGRLDLLNLYPLLIHLNLFGSGYSGSIRSILSKFV